MKYIQEPKDYCPIYEDCNLRDTERCTEYCWKMIQMRYQLDNSGIPEDYKCDIRLSKKKGDLDYDSFLELASWVSDLKKLYWRIFYQGEGMFLYSRKKGNGKTSWACKIMYTYIRAMDKRIQSLEKPLVKFVSVPKLFDALRHGIDNPTPEIIELEKSIKEADLVIFDDIGAESPSKWVKEKLYIYINERESNRKATIFTSNLSLDELEESLGERITDRIYGLCRRKYGEDWRANRIYNLFEFKDTYER